MEDKEDMADSFDKNLIFIAGPAHSGTSLLEVLLRHHSSIGSVGLDAMDENCLEMFQIDDIIGCINSKECPRASSLYDTNSCIRTSIGAPGKLFLYKNPDNIFYLDKLKESIVKSKVIIIYRNPKDTALSLLARGRHNTFRECLEYWAAAYAYAEKFANEVFCLAIKYEDLAENAGGQLTKIFNFLGIEDQGKAILRGYEERSKQHSLGHEYPEELCEKEEHILRRKQQLAQKIYIRKRRDLTPGELIIYNEVISKTSYKD
jgi:hypothetical protein